MDQQLRKLAITCKGQLISRNLIFRKKGILRIKEYLQTDKSDSFVNIILDLDIQDFLLKLLITSNYSVSPEILKCLELLCSYKIYFTRDLAVVTAEIILKNLFSLISDHKYDNIVIESLKIITTIIENLDDYYSKHQLNFLHYLDTIRNLLFNKEDPVLIYTIIKMFSALLLHEKFQNYIDDNIINDIDILWHLSLQKLKEIFIVHTTSSVIGVCKLCDSILRMLTKILIYKKDKIEKFYENVQIISVNCMKFICIPYIDEFGLTSNNICLEYLFFLKTLLKSNLSKDILITICQKLVNDFNFTVITKYLDIIVTISNTEEQEKMRELCLIILCEVIVNLTDINSCLYSEEKCKKYVFKHLHTIMNTNVQKWLNLLKDSQISMDTKLIIIKFCTMYYVYSKNLSEIQLEHLESLIEFLKYFPKSMNVNIYFLKDLWLLFAVICCSFPEKMKNDDFALLIATSSLERLIFVYEGSFDKILTYHPSVISWIFMNPFVKKKLIYAVMHRCLLHGITDAPSRCALLHAVTKWRTGATLLLASLQHGTAPIAAAAADILRAALEQGAITQDQDFVQQLCVAVPDNIMRLNHQEVVRDRVMTCIYMLHLSSYVQTPTDHSFLVYSICKFTSCVGPLGLSDILPPIFYIKAFDYANKILGVARSNQISQVFMTFMNSEPMLYTLMRALISEDQQVSVKAGQLFNNLLEYQAAHRLYCKNTLIIKKDFLVKLMSVGNIEQLQLNLQIVKILLFKTGKSVLDLEIDEKILKGLYFRCLNLVTKPGDHNLGQFGLKCLEGILRYSHFHNQKSLDYLCHHPGNHTMILTFFDKEICRPINRAFLSFIQCLLQYTVKNKEKVYNRLSITHTFWKMSLYQITEMILNIKIETNNADVVHNIFRQLFQFSDLLPPFLASQVRIIEDNSN